MLNYLYLKIYYSTANRIDQIFIYSDWIKVNVSDKVFITSRKTLCWEPDSALAVFISNYTTKAVKFRPDSGELIVNDRLKAVYDSASKTVYFDMNPKYFKIILDYLRYGKVFKTPELKEYYEGVCDDIRLFGLTNMMQQLSNIKF